MLCTLIHDSHFDDKLDLVSVRSYSAVPCSPSQSVFYAMIFVL